MTTEQEMTLKEWVEKLPECHLARKQYNQLLRDSDVLLALEGAGVDNWDGYDYAMENIDD